MDEKAKSAVDLVCRLIKDFNTERDTDTLRLLIAVLMSVQVSVPMTVSMENADVEKFFHAKAGDTVTTGGAIRMKPDMLKNGAGELFFSCFHTSKGNPGGLSEYFLLDHNGLYELCS